MNVIIDVIIKMTIVEVGSDDEDESRMTNIIFPSLNPLMAA